MAPWTNNPPSIAGWGDIAPCLYYRCKIPFRGLARAGLVGDTTIAMPPGPDNCPCGDITVLHRPIRSYLGEQIASLQANGALVVCDDDDPVDRLPLEETLEKEDRPVQQALMRVIPALSGESAFDYMDRAIRIWLEGTWPMRAFMGQLLTAQLGGRDARLQRGLSDVIRIFRTAHSFEEALARLRGLLSPNASYHDALRSADLITASTPNIRDALERHGTPVVVLPNCIDLRLPCYAEPAHRVPYTGVTIGWAGLPGNATRLGTIWEPLRLLLREFDGTEGRPFLRLVVGCGARHLAELLADDGIPSDTAFRSALADVAVHEDADEPDTWSGFRTLESADGRILFRPGTADIEAVPLMYADVDVGLVPNPLDRALSGGKSDIKGLEMAGMGVPCVASPIPAYQEWRGRDGTGAIVLPDNEPESWLIALRRLILDTDLRKRMAAEARAFAETRSIDRWAPKWMDAYASAAHGRKKTA